MSHNHFQSLSGHPRVDQPLSQSSTNVMSTRILDAMLSSRVFHLNHDVGFLANQPDDPTDSILRHSVGVMPQTVIRLSIRVAAKPFDLFGRNGLTIGLSGPLASYLVGLLIQRSRVRIPPFSHTHAVVRKHVEFWSTALPVERKTDVENWTLVRSASLCEFHLLDVTKHCVYFALAGDSKSEK